MTGKLSTLVRLMAYEEWRMHSTLFDGRRFAGFAISLALLSVTASFALAQIGISVTAIVAGVIVLASLLGLQTGSIGFEGRDALENLIGDVTPLIYSTRTLPLSGRKAFLAFALKDLGYYAVMFLLPISVGATAGIVGASMMAMGGMMGTPMSVGVVGAVGIAVKTWVFSAVSFLLGLLGGLLLAGVPVKARAIGRNRNDTHTTTELYTRLAEVVGRTAVGAVAAKTVLDVHRSSGGIWKLLLSSATLVGASYVALELVGQHIPLSPSYGVLFGVFLSVTAFPTYSWVTQTDDPSDYALYPLTTREVVGAKARAFVLLQIPVVAVYYSIGFVALSPSLVDVLVGTVVLAGLVAYVFGLTVALTGFKPSEYLFDTVVFSKYSLGVIIALLPPLMTGLFVPVSGMTAAALAAYGGLFGLIGLLLFKNAQVQLRTELDGNNS